MKRIENEVLQCYLNQQMFQFSDTIEIIPIQSNQVATVSDKKRTVFIMGNGKTYKKTKQYPYFSARFYL